MYSGYNSIYEIYDEINSEINYSEWAGFIESCFEKFLSDKPELVLDLACGTGSMTLELASRGYDMIGVDGSEEMLSRAYEKMYDKEQSGILYIRQDMRNFELYGTVGAVSCCLDSINYLCGEDDLISCFSCVHNYLDPDGLFIFDVNSPYKFENIYADNSYVHETEHSLCTWQNEYDKNTRLCNFYLSVFNERENGLYERIDEVQTERCYTQGELADALKSTGFELIGIYGDYDFSEPKDNTERLYIVARAKKQ